MFVKWVLRILKWRKLFQLHVLNWHLDGNNFSKPDSYQSVNYQNMIIAVNCINLYDPITYTAFMLQLPLNNYSVDYNSSCTCRFHFRRIKRLIEIEIDVLWIKIKFICTEFKCSISIKNSLRSCNRFKNI